MNWHSGVSGSGRDSSAGSIRYAEPQAAHSAVQHAGVEPHVGILEAHQVHVLAMNKKPPDNSFTTNRGCMRFSSATLMGEKHNGNTCRG